MSINKMSYSASEMWSTNNVEMRKLLFPGLDHLAYVLPFTDLEQEERDKIIEMAKQFK